MKNSKIKNFFAAFALTGILIGAFCGFALVDLSTDRYMPGQFGSFFEIGKVKAESVEFSFLADRYILETQPTREIGELIKKYRGLLPILPQIFSSLAAEATGHAIPLLPAIGGE